MSKTALILEELLLKAKIVNIWKPLNILTRKLHPLRLRRVAWRKVCRIISPTKSTIEALEKGVEYCQS